MSLQSLVFVTLSCCALTAWGQGTVAGEKTGLAEPLSPSGGARIATAEGGDVDPPVVNITVAPDFTSDPTPTFSFTANEPAEFKCAIDANPLAPCTSPFTSGNLSDGPHTFFVQGTDLSANIGELVSHDFVIDTIAPQANLVSTPGDPSNDPSPVFEFTVSPGGSPVSTQCRVDGEPYAPCTSPHETAVLDDGPHIIQIQATDAAGNNSTEFFIWTIDTIAPVVSLVSPVELTNDNTPSFDFIADEPSDFQCHVDADPAQPCIAPFTSLPLTDGPHVFVVVGADGAGNTSEPASHHFMIDTTVPLVNFVSTPDDPSNDAIADFAFTVSPGGSPVNTECRVDGQPFAPCTSPHTTAPLAEGPHQFEVRATDAAGNLSVEPFNWTIDVTAPAVNLVSPPTQTRDNTPTFEFFAEEPAAFECAVDAADFAACVSPFTTDPLSEGAYTFRVRATDLADNTGPTESHDFVILPFGPIIFVDDFENAP